MSKNELKTLFEVEFERAKKAGQEHVFQCWSTLDEKSAFKLVLESQSIDYENIAKNFEAACQPKANIEWSISPPNRSICGSGQDSNLHESCHSLGLALIRSGKVGLILMAGGQGTRLGVTHPKGMYDVGLPSHKSLYQLQAERICRLQTISECTSAIPWYIMTSDHTRDATMAFFEQHSYFGLSPSNVIFFEQEEIPSLDLQGRILMESSSSISKAPNGNGGLYRVLNKSGVLEDMQRRGLLCVHVYGVDNILVRVCDPAFIGFCFQMKAEAGAKTVEKIDPHEAVGVICRVDGKYQVVEYSEISAKTAELREPMINGDHQNQRNRLLYHEGSICNHFFTVEFLSRICSPQMESQLTFHVARKKIPFFDFLSQSQITPSEPNGIKLEKFVFDVFPFAKSFAIWQVDRTEEFSPLKNAPGSSADCPETARRDLLHFHRQLLLQALSRLEITADLTGIEVEISPLISYEGEGLLELQLDWKALQFAVGPMSIELSSEGCAQLV